MLPQEAVCKEIFRPFGIVDAIFQGWRCRFPLIIITPKRGQTLRDEEFIFQMRSHSSLVSAISRQCSIPWRQKMVINIIFQGSIEHWILIEN